MDSIAADEVGGNRQFSHHESCTTRHVLTVKQPVRCLVITECVRGGAVIQIDSTPVAREMSLRVPTYVDGERMRHISQAHVLVD